ncbi:MAG: ABC transporter ATP-binding protein [Patescibacteria group bacterium]
MIKGEKILKKYGSGELELTVLKEIDIEIKTGEFVAIIGPSGAGKSTLLYQLSLLDTLTSGEVYFNGKPTSGLSESQKTNLRLSELGYVFQDYALLPELTVLENVALPMLMQGMSKHEAYKKSDEALERIGIKHKRNNLPNQLSGGQQQRVSIARAIAHKPHILFADEPTANLDSENAKIVIDVFLKLNSEGQSIIMVTHENEYARKAQRTIALKDGIIVSDTKNVN